MKRTLVIIILALTPFAAKAQLLSGKFLTSDHIPFYRNGALTNLTLGDGLAVSGSTLSSVLDIRQVWPMFGSAFNFTYTNVILTNLANGVADIITVPAGVRLYSRDVFIYQTNTILSTVSLFLKTNSVYYRLIAPTGIGSQTPQNPTPLAYLEPGDILSITNNRQGTYVIYTGMLYSTNTGLKTVRLPDTPTTPTLLYEVPVGKMAFSVNPGLSTQGPRIILSNDSGTNRMFNVFLVPPGGTTNTASQVMLNRDVANANIASSDLSVLPAGWQVWAQSDDATGPHLIVIHLYEADVP